MKTIKSLIAITALVLCASCTNNNHDSSGMDSASVSTNPAMGGSTDTGMTSSDSTDIRMPMSDTSHNAGAATGQGDDTSHH
jgi:hypothetical protein